MTKLHHNDIVWVRFTEHGVKARRKCYEEITRRGIPISPTDPPGTWVRTSLWSLMAEVGHAMKVGGPPMFVDGEIWLTDPELDDGHTSAGREKGPVLSRAEREAINDLFQPDLVARIDPNTGQRTVRFRGDGGGGFGG